MLKKILFLSLVKCEIEKNGIGCVHRMGVLKTFSFGVRKYGLACYISSILACDGMMEFLFLFCFYCCVAPRLFGSISVVCG